MRVLIAFLIGSALACAQAIPVIPPGTVTSTLNTGRLITITVSRQPAAAFKAALGSLSHGVTGYSSRVCNAESVAVTVSGGAAAQWIEAHGLPIIPVQVAAMIATAARTHSTLYRVAEYTAEAGFYASLAISGGWIAASSKVIKIAPVIIAHEAEAAKDALSAQLPDPTATFKDAVLTDTDIALQPGACRTLLFLGDSNSKVETLSGEVYGR